MRKLLFVVAAALVLAPPSASANARGATITTQMISPASAARYVYTLTGSVNAVANGNVVSVWTPFAARLVDLIVYQQTAGTGGTSFTVDVKTAGGTSLLATLPVQTLASGADKLADAKGALALPSGWTRPVIKTDGAEVVTKGQRLVISTVETGSYSGHPLFQVTLVYEPLR